MTAQGIAMIYAFDEADDPESARQNSLRRETRPFVWFERPCTIQSRAGQEFRVPIAFLQQPQKFRQKLRIVLACFAHKRFTLSRLALQCVAENTLQLFPALLCHELPIAGFGVRPVARPLPCSSP